jgi:hypothetical protein
VAHSYRSSVVRAVFGTVPKLFQLVPLFVEYLKNVGLDDVFAEATSVPLSSYALKYMVGTLAE